MVKTAVALFDMDGTLCDYELAMNDQLVRTFSKDELERYQSDPASICNDPGIEHRRLLIKRQPGFWRALEPIPFGMELFRFITMEPAFKPVVLTKGPESTPSAWQEKVEWCRRHLPGVQVTITQDKSLVYGRLLIDDWPPFVEPWLTWRPRGFVIMPAYDYNAHFSHPRVLRVDPKQPDWHAIHTIMDFALPH